MASKIKVDEIAGSTGSTVTVPTGQTLTIADGLAASTIASGTLADARIPNLSATKITTGELANARVADLPASKITTGTLANARVADLPTSKITSGTMADARISASSVTQHVAATNLQPVQHDIQTLALQTAIADNKAAYSLTNSYIEQFEDDTGLLTQTDGDRSGDEYWSTVSTGARFTTIKVNNADYTTAEKKFGTGSLYNPANGDFLKTSTLTGITDMVTTGNYTLDVWAKYGISSGYGTDRIVGFTNAADANLLSFGYGSSTNFNAYHSGNHCFTYPTFNQDWHLYSQQGVGGGTTHLWLDGIHKGSYTNTVSDLTGTAGSLLQMGGRGGSVAEDFQGYIDDVRLSKVKRYTDSVNFTVPTSAYTADADTMMLLHMDTSDLVDSSLLTANATGTLICNTVTANAATTKVSGIVLYKNASGTTALNTDLTCEFSANNGSNWTASTMTAGGTFSTGILIAKCPEVTVTSGTQIKYRLVFANQASGSKETQIHGVALTY